MKQVYQIREYGSFITGISQKGYVTLPKTTFEQLESFLLTTHRGKEDALDFMSVSARRGIGKVITVKNYVGIIVMRDGTTVEILPKIVSENSDEDGAKSKRLLLDMLKTLKNAPFKSIQTAAINLEKMNILEIFIKMFLDDVFYLVKRGLKCGYESIEENVAYVQGKLKFTQQVKYNYVHKERNYIEHDIFTVNRPENRLIKAALEFLSSKTSSAENKKNIKILLNQFDGVQPSREYQKDLLRCTTDRTMKDYETVLRWCKVFLSGKSFGSYSGSEVALVLLFPMETLFESYIAALLKYDLPSSDFSVIAQDKRFHLFEKSTPEFQLKPDIVVTRKYDGAIFIMDTKWKLLASSKPHYGISQADMYQMYAYHKKYHAENVTLLYPQTDSIPPDQQISYEADDGAVVHVKFIDLFDVKNSIEQIADTCKL